MNTVAIKQGVTPKLKQGKKNRRKKYNKAKATVYDSVLYSQNIHGLFESKKDKWFKPIRGERSYVKLEFIIHKMREENIDAYLLQETWEEMDWIQEIDGYTIFHHNSNKKHERKGVAIILSPRFSQAWRDAGGLDPITTERGSEFEGRFIAVKIKVLKSKRKRKKEWQNTFTDVI